MIQIKRLNKKIELPCYGTGESVGMDCYVSKNTVIPAKSHTMIPLGIVVKAPPGTFTGLLSRSSTFKKYGLMLTNSLGIIDPDYCGEEDEIYASVYNTNPYDTYVMEGERLFQLVVFNAIRPEIVEVEKMSEESRGGFGSTGV